MLVMHMIHASAQGNSLLDSNNFAPFKTLVVALAASATEIL